MTKTKEEVRFRTNHGPWPEVKEEEIIEGVDQCVPGQAVSVTEVVYRFQGGIIPDFKNVQYDPEEMPDEHMDVRRLSGFDITDAFNALQQGREKYTAYIKEKNAKARAEIAAREAEFKRLQELEKQLNSKEDGNNI